MKCWMGEKAIGAGGQANRNKEGEPISQADGCLRWVWERVRIEARESGPWGNRISCQTPPKGSLLGPCSTILDWRLYLNWHECRHRPRRSRFLAPNSVSFGNIRRNLRPHGSHVQKLAAVKRTVSLLSRLCCEILRLSGVEKRP